MSKLIRGGVAAAVLATALGGCISVKTPDKPIEINLNVNIKQEVLVRLQRDVENLINQNPQSFPGASGSTTTTTTVTPPRDGTKR